MFLESSGQNILDGRQKILDAMEGQEAEKELVKLLPTEKKKQSFREDIASFLKANNKEKTLSKDEIENLLVRKLLELTNPNSEYDILFFRKVGRK